jgi:predicted phosphodiesterase/transposase-like protein
MATKPLDKKRKLEAYKTVAKYGTVTAAAQQLGVPVNTLQSRLRAALADPKLKLKDPRGPTRQPMNVVVPSQEERREVIALRAENQKLRQVLKGSDAAAIELDRLRALALGLRQKPMAPPAWTMKLAAMKPDAPGVPVIHMTDWHIGETVDPDQVDGVNRFDAGIADARVRRCIERVLHLAFKHVAVPQYDHAVVALGGDFVSGWLHEELVATDWCTPLQAVKWCVSRLRWALGELLAAFGRLRVVAVPGNHGRLMKRPPAKLGAYQSLDWLIYGMLQEIFADNPSIHIEAPASGEWLGQVGGKQILVMHGHELGVSGGDGIIGALGPIMRGATKVGRAGRSVGRDFDLLLLGHWHQHLWLPGIAVSGSLKGYDEYSRARRFTMQPSEQTLFFMHPRFGANMPWRLFLQEDAAPAVRSEAA